MDKVRVQKLCLAVFAVSVALILLTTVVNWIGGAVIDSAFAELGEDDYGLISYAKGETVKLVRSVLTGGTLSLFTSVDSLAGGSEISSLVPMMDDWFSSMIREMVKENLNPFAYFLVNVWAYMPHILDVAYISCALSAVIWYVMGGRFDTAKSLIAAFGTASRFVKGASSTAKPPVYDTPVVTPVASPEAKPLVRDVPFVPSVKTWACTCGQTNPEEKKYCMTCRKDRYVTTTDTVPFMFAPSDDDL